MTVAAPPAGPEAPGGPDRGPPTAAVTAAAGRGLLAFVLVTLASEAIAMAEFALTNGAYRAWTWIKVGFLYLLSFCGVGLRAESPVLPPLPATELRYRLPMMAGTALVLWLLFLAGRAAGRRATSPRAPLAGVLAAALAFAVPVFLVSLPAMLRFPGVDVSPVRWQAALLPLCLALPAAAVGAHSGLRSPSRGGTGGTGRLVAMAQGGSHMFLLAVGFTLVGSLVLVTVKPDWAQGYASWARDAGRAGAVTVAHHALLLPNQSIWVLAPAMGGSTQLALWGDDRFPATVTMTGIDPGALGALWPSGSGDRIAFGGWSYLFGVVPLAATVLGGRRAAAGAGPTRERIALGMGAGVVFAILMAAAALFSSSALPLPPLEGAFAILPVSIRATMPSTAVLALAWGALGGAAGAVTAASRPGSRPVADVDQDPEGPAPADPA